MAAAAKICIVCKKDCTGQPRTKDSRGRYFHRQCFEKAKRRLQAAKAARDRGPAAPQPEVAPVAEIVDDGLESLAAFESGPTGDGCPGCGGPLAPDAILCTGCGYNRVTGRQIQTDLGGPPTVVEGPARKARGGGNAGAGFANFVKQPWAFGLASLSFFALFFFVAKDDTDLLLAYTVVRAFFGLAVGITLLVIAFQDSVGNGLLCLFTCGIYALYYCYLVQDNAYVKWGYGVTVLAGLLPLALGYDVLPGQ